MGLHQKYFQELIFSGDWLIGLFLAMEDLKLKLTVFFCLLFLLVLSVLLNYDFVDISREFWLRGFSFGLAEQLSHKQ